ncbi:anthranilate synthase component I [Actinopolymorpha alba]|uniref:anthranilate synthase component I n=1 Tax=Actinopolymorpha alba TaxID=533267 RepID=UPI00037370E1|nr:anthranilate synthase component I [Actinopolymorpha alba]
MDSTARYLTAGGISILRTTTSTDETELQAMAADIDGRRGGILSSGVDYPGRYSRWHLAYLNPPIEIVARGRRVEAVALNARGRVLLPTISAVMTKTGEIIASGPERTEVFVPPSEETFAEEDRSRQPTVFTTLRAIVGLFASAEDPHLGLYGAYGYDLAFQFEPLRPHHDRTTDPLRDFVLHLPDEILVLDRKRETCLRHSYDFEIPDHEPATAATTRTTGLARTTAPTPAPTARPLPPAPTPGQYAQVVREAREYFRRGDLFEVTPSHLVSGPCDSPAAFYERLRTSNPAPYEFVFNLGAGEYLVGASPEMYVRVTGDRVETCPIAGTIRRGADPLEDARQIQTLLNSSKDESELTMCTDVDRNDKSRVCVPGSVRVIGRRQIELYSRLIHTVDHIEGKLLPGRDAFDAFLTHMWAVTVTGAPKQWAMRFIEEHEDAPRRWYGGAVGFVGFDGSMNTGLSLRTAQVEDGIAAVRVGATLLYDSDPEEEERETLLKAQALLDALSTPSTPSVESGTAGHGRAYAAASLSAESLPGNGLRVLLVDHQDSFVHTLGDYFRQQGAAVTTLRFGFAERLLDELAPDLVVLSPGPGRPSDFDCAGLLRAVEARSLPMFGVCLGLQAMVEYDGGQLEVLPYPAHGRPGEVRVLNGSGLLAGLGEEFVAGRYHSLYATPDQVSGFEVTGVLLDPSGAEVAMTIEDPVRRRWAVQFHPESILSAGGRAGHRVVANALALSRTKAPVSLR